MYVVKIVIDVDHNTREVYYPYKINKNVKVPNFLGSNDKKYFIQFKKFGREYEAVNYFTLYEKLEGVKLIENDYFGNKLTSHYYNR